MQPLWLSFKANTACCSKLTDVIHTKKCVHQKIHIARDELEASDEVACRVRDSRHQVITRQLFSQPQFCELSVGDPARNVIEMIFQRASTNPLKPVRKILRVIRVENLIRTLEMFESYRERVKRNARLQQNRRHHPRSTVDGYELLRFYGTTMSCCNSTQSMKREVTNLCRYATCGVCRAIQSNFETAYTKKRSGVCLSTKSEELSDNTIIFMTARKIERAVILCRTIAGTVVNTVNNSNDSELIIPDPRAVLPCFVLVFN